MSNHVNLSVRSKLRTLSGIEGFSRGNSWRRERIIEHVTERKQVAIFPTKNNGDKHFSVLWKSSLIKTSLERVDYNFNAIFFESSQLTIKKGINKT